jgi:hypothetical protein
MGHAFFRHPGRGTGVYQAAGWIYLGQGLDGKNRRTRRYVVLPPGADRNVAANWKTTRELRRAGNRMTWAEARKAGWEISSREAKHVYATHVGRGRREWRDLFPGLPYPSPRPELKLGRKADQPSPISRSLGCPVLPP